MDSTQQSMSIAIETAIECASLACQSVLEEEGVKFDELAIKSRIKQRFDYIAEDSGVKSNLIGRAITVDQALRGERNSAIRNREWMTSYHTVKKLDYDVNALRMLLSSKGIDMKMRVLNSCFKVYRKPGKSSSIIEAKPLFLEKIKRGEVIEIDNVKSIGDGGDKSVIDELKKLRQELEDKDREMIKYQAMVVKQHTEWKEKLQQLTNDLEASQRDLASSIAAHNHLSRLVRLMDKERNQFIEALVKNTTQILHVSRIDAVPRDDYILSLSMITGMDDQSILKICDLLQHIILDYSDVLQAARGMALKLGYTMQFEPEMN